MLIIKYNLFLMLCLTNQFTNLSIGLLKSESNYLTLNSQIDRFVMLCRSYVNLQWYISENSNLFVEYIV